MRKLFHFETKSDPLASRRVFYNRLTRNGVWSLGTVTISLIIGSWGYMFYEAMDPLDAFANASMILSGMGPLSPLTTTGGKVFASVYAIASGLMLFAIAGLMLAPIYHRILHRFHVDETDGQDDDQPQPQRFTKEYGPDS